MLQVNRKMASAPEMASFLHYLKEFQTGNSEIFEFLRFMTILTLKRLGGINLILPHGFPKNVFTRKIDVKYCFFVTFKVITSCIFLKPSLKFIKFCNYFVNFLDFVTFSYYKKN